MTGSASRPLFRDPVFDGATDPAVIHNRQTGEWWMFYTARRASAPGLGVAWVHGTAIGIASSGDGGATWLYRGTARGLHFEPGHNTYWAPEVMWAEGCYHMFVSYVRGVPDRWEGHGRRILHYTSANLLDWGCAGALDLRSDRVIDAAVYPVPGGYRMWFKDEEHDSHTYAADCAEGDGLTRWSAPVPVLTHGGHEGPNVFALGGYFWLIVDEWRGLGVYRSTDLESWQRNGMILDIPGTGPDDGDIGRHADVVEVHGDAYAFYFTNPGRDAAPGSDFSDSYEIRRSSVHVAQLRVTDGTLTCDRDRPVPAPFLPATP